MMFGISGIFIGVLIASLFVTIGELYGIIFNDYLPEVYRTKKVPVETAEQDAEGQSGS